MKKIAKLHDRLSYKKVCELLGITPAQQGPAKDAQIEEIQKENYLHEHKNRTWTLAPLGYKEGQEAVREQNQATKKQEREEKIKRGIIIVRKNYTINLNDSRVYKPEEMRRLMLWHIGSVALAAQTETAYIASFFACLKFFAGIQGFQSWYELYPREVVMYGGDMILERFKDRYKSYLRSLFKNNRILWECGYRLYNRNTISENEHDFWQNFVMEEMRKDSRIVCKVNEKTIQRDPRLKKLLEPRLRGYIAKTFGSDIRYKRTFLTPCGCIEDISQLEYEKIMVYFIEVMRESMLKSIRDKNSHTSTMKGYICPEFKEPLLDFINEFVMYVSPQGEEIRTLDDVIDKEACGDYQREEHTQARDFDADIYAVREDNKFHAFYNDNFHFLTKAPLFGEARAEEDEIDLESSFGEGELDKELNEDAIKHYRDKRQVIE